jgi:hypothetical protein
MNWLEKINADLKKANRQEYNRKWREEHKDHIRRTWAVYKEKHKERLKQQRRAKNEARAIAEGRVFKTKEQGQANKKRKLEQKAERARLKALETPEIKLARRLQQLKDYRERNKERIKLREKQSRQRRREKLKNDPAFKLNHGISNGILKALKRSKNRYHWEKLVPYTLDQLKVHLENQFVEGMTWENHGKIWHIDHIKPRCSFNFSSPQDEEFQKCWALDNLRPLWAVDNLKKAIEDRKLKVKK